MKLILIFLVWLTIGFSEFECRPHHEGILASDTLETHHDNPKSVNTPSPILLHHRDNRQLKNPDYIELLSEESRHKNKRQSYNHKSPPKRHHYQTQNRHSDGGRVGKGGYHKSDSYKGNKGYSDSSTYNRANKNSYGDGDHKQYGSRDGGRSGGGHSGGNSYGGQSGSSRNGHGNSGGYFGDEGRGKYSKEYSDNGNSYLSAGGGEY